MYTDFAYAYDALMKDVDYGAWCDYYEAVFKKFNIKKGLGLDLGCGTGSMTIELSRRGCDMTGVDISDDMLAIAREKSEAAGQDILFLNQSMDGFELYGTVDFAVSSLDCVNYITDKRNLRRAFKLVNNYLDPRGIFIFDINTPYKLKEILGKNTFISDEDGIFYAWESFFDQKSRLCEFDLTIFREDGGGYKKIVETQVERAYEIDEISALIESAGMKLLGVYDDRTFDKPKKTSERVFFVAMEQGKS